MNQYLRLLIAGILFIAVSATQIQAQVTWSEPFEECGIEGSITLYDYNNDRWMTNDPQRSVFPTLPASTFKIMNTLIVLETVAVWDQKTMIPWHGNPDTLNYGYRPGIYHDMNLEEAFEKSAGWVYVELAKKVGKERYRYFLEESNYGNADVSVAGPDFWNFGPMAISPVNQIEILKGVYEETLPFSERSFNIVKEMMVEEQTDSYTLRAKTGWTRDGGNDTGWWVGYVERADSTWFFATRLIKDRSIVNERFNSCRKEITRKVLQGMDVIE